MIQDHQNFDRSSRRMAEPTNNKRKTPERPSSHLQSLREALRSQITDSASLVSDFCDTFEQSLQNEMERIQTAVDAVIEVIDSESAKIEQHETMREENNKKMKTNYEAVSNRVVFDVGGQIFSAAKENFLSHPGSYFSALLSSGNWKPDENGI